MQNLHNRPIRCVISGLFRGRATNAPANDNVAAIAVVLANDNRTPTPPAKYRRPTSCGSLLSVVQEEQGSPRVILSMAKADASALNIKAGHYVLASVTVVTDPYFATIVEAVSVRRVKRGTQGAVQVEANGEGLPYSRAGCAGQPLFAKARLPQPRPVSTEEK